MATQTQPRRSSPPPAAAPPPGLAAAVPGIAAALASVASPILALPAIAVLMAWQTALELLILGFVLKLVGSQPLPLMIGIGPAQRYVITMNQLRNAAYVYTSAQRIRSEISSGMSREDAEEREQHYFRMHLHAVSQRQHAANRIDGLAMQHGDILGWYAVPDAKTTAECRAANGKNFRATIPPVIGWPGIVHTNCRCYPGPPWPRGRMLP